MGQSHVRRVPWEKRGTRNPHTPQLKLVPGLVNLLPLWVMPSGPQGNGTLSSVALDLTLDATLGYLSLRSCGPRAG